MDFDRLSTLLLAANATNAAGRRAVYQRLRTDARASDPKTRKAACLSLESAIGLVEARALSDLRDTARPVLVTEEFVPVRKDKMAA